MGKKIADVNIRKNLCFITFKKKLNPLNKIKYQPRELGKKCDGKFTLTFAVTQVRYDAITTTKRFVKSLLFLVVYQQCNNTL